MGRGLRADQLAKEVSYVLIIRPEAEADITEAFDWYEERKAGLGHDFLREVRLVLRQIEQNPLRHSAIYRKARRALTGRFPYKIFYLFAGKKIEIIGVIHAKREPRLWQRRVR